MIKRNSPLTTGKLLLPVSLLLLSTLSHANDDSNHGISEACRNYTERKSEGGGFPLSSPEEAAEAGAALLTVAVKKQFPYVYEVGRILFEDDDTTGPDLDLVACLQEFDTRIDNLEEFQYFGTIELELQAFYTGLKNDLIDQSNLGAHYNAYTKYDEIREYLGGLILEALQSPEFPTSETVYHTLRDDTITYMINTYLWGYLHNLEFNAYCAKSGTRWTDAALMEIEYGSSNNWEAMDFSAQNKLTIGDESAFENSSGNSSHDNCEIGRDSYSRFMDATIADSTLFARALEAMGVNVSLGGGKNNYLNVTTDINNSKLLEFRNSLVGSCSSGEDGPLFKDGAVVYREWAEVVDQAAAPTPEKFRVSSLAAPGARDAVRNSKISECEEWRTQRFKDNKEEIEDLLYSIQVTLQNLSLYDYSRPANELAGRKMPYETYVTGIIPHESLKDYMLVPRFITGTDTNENIIDNFNHYQLFHSRDNKYLKHRSNFNGPRTISNGIGLDSHWEIFNEWPGKRMQIRNIHTNQCLTEYDDINDPIVKCTLELALPGDIDIDLGFSLEGEYTPEEVEEIRDSLGPFASLLKTQCRNLPHYKLDIQNCDSSSYVWDFDNTNDSPAESYIYLHASDHTGQCLETENSKLVRKACTQDNDSQVYISWVFSQGTKPLIADRHLNCLGWSGNTPSAGTGVFAAACSENSDGWVFNRDGTIEAGVLDNNGDALCLDAGATVNSSDITLEICNPNSPTQKFIRRSLLRENPEN